MSTTKQYPTNLAKVKHKLNNTLNKKILVFFKTKICRNQKQTQI
jgi:hypothetical protein